MYDELLKQIEQLLQEKQRVIVAISGYGGAGKTHLSERLAKHLNISDKQVLHMDFLHTPPEESQNSQDVFSGHDWGKIYKILDEYKSGKRLQYESMGLWGHVHKFDEPAPKVLILEGVRALRKEAIPYYDLSVWIDASADYATERGKMRDREMGQDEKHIKRWDEEWTPKNDEYFRQVQPDKLANFIFTEYK